MRVVNRAFHRIMWDDDPEVPEPTPFDRVVVNLHIRWLRFLIRISRPGPCGCRYILGYRTAVVHDCEEHFPLEAMDE